MSVGIYKIISPSGKIYIGQSKNIEKRLIHYSKYRCKSQSFLYASFKKYKFKNHEFEIVYVLPDDVDQKVLDQFEIFFISQLKEGGFNLLNLKDGGNGCNPTIETREKFRMANLGRRGKGMYGKKHSEESKLKMSQNLKGHMPHNKNKTTPENVKKKQSESAKKRILKFGRLGLDQTGKKPWNKK